MSKNYTHDRLLYVLKKVVTHQRNDFQRYVVDRTVSA